MRLGDYTLEAELGRGGMGRVFRARHVATGALRAVKVLEGAADPETVARFRREAETLARVGAEVAVGVHEVGSERGRVWFAMDLMPGGSLADRLARGPLPWREAAALAARLARGLARCHEEGVVHRDLKPANILFDETGAPRLADFGLARDLGLSALTQSGAMLGTPSYMSCEQLDGKRAGPPADVYALGVVLHELVTGRRPHEARTWPELARAALAGLPRPIAASVGAPAALDRLLAGALDPDPERRPTAAELGSELEALGQRETQAGSRLLLALGVASVVVVAGALALFARAHAPDSAPAVAPSPSPSPGRSRDHLPRDAAELALWIRQGRIGAPELERIAGTPEGAAGFAKLADEGAILPPSFHEALHARLESPSLAILDGIAVLASSTDLAERSRALDQIRRAHPRGVALLLLEPASAVARLEREARATLEAPFTGGAPHVAGTELEEILRDLSSRPDLISVAALGLVPLARDQVIADKLPGEKQILGHTLRGLEHAAWFGALPPELQAAAVRFGAEWPPGPRGAPDWTRALDDLAAKLEGSDPLLATAPLLRAEGSERDLAAADRRLEKVRALLARVVAHGDQREVGFASWCGHEVLVDACWCWSVEALFGWSDAPRCARALARAEALATEALDQAVEHREVLSDDDRTRDAHRLVAIRLARGEELPPGEVRRLAADDPLVALLAEPLDRAAVARTCARVLAAGRASSNAKAWAGAIGAYLEQGDACLDPDSPYVLSPLELLATRARLGRAGK